MSSSQRGTSISGPEVTHVSRNGLWLLAGGRELFLAFEDFPWFRDATISAIINVREVREGHYHWPDLDVDLSREIIEHPQRFPLVARGSAP